MSRDLVHQYTNTIRANTARAVEIGWTASDATYNCKANAIDSPLDIMEIAAMGSMNADEQGVIMEGPIQYNWAMRTETWSTDGNITAPRLLSVVVDFPVQSQRYSVRLSTLARVPQS